MWIEFFGWNVPTATINFIVTTNCVMPDWISFALIAKKNFSRMKPRGLMIGHKDSNCY